MCTNSSNGEHNYQLQAIIFDDETVMVRVCLLCGDRA